MNNMFEEEFEKQAIDRIRRFAKLAKSMGFEVCLGFSGGKDSQVTYDLCKRSGIEFKAFFNHSFESSTTMHFIKEHYPEVKWRREHHAGFIENIWKYHGGMLPDTRHAYCCYNYKHNPKYVDDASILGVRKAESAKRAKHTVLGIKNKTTLKKNKTKINEYFYEHCQNLGATSTILLLPIVDWTEEDVWTYIKHHNLPVNPEYSVGGARRVGCVICPKASFNRNAIELMKHPKLIDAFIRAREKGREGQDWTITGDGMDYTNNKPYYICRWLNHSFMPFTARQFNIYQQVREQYDKLHNTNKTE